MMNKTNLKIAGLLAVAVVVVGATIIIASSSLGEGVSADLGDVAAGEVVLMPQDDYQMALEKLGDYFMATDKTTQDNIISDVVKILQDAKK